MVCISNCDKITPGMLMAALRINIPVVFVSGGPMEAGKVVLNGKTQALDLVDAMVAAADEHYSDEDVTAIERAACPTCGRSEEHTSELQSLMRHSYAVFCLKQKTTT